MHRLIFCAIFAAFLAHPVLCAAEPLRTATAGISGGELDGDGNPSVLGMSRAVFGTCSGSLIAPNLVLTAQHCVANTASPRVLCGSAPFTSRIAPQFFTVTTEPVIELDQRNYRGLQLHLPPGDGDLCGQDVALLILEENIPEDEAEYLIPRIDIPVEPGETYTAIGYGHTGDGTDSGVRRILTDRVVQCVNDECGFGTQVSDREFLGSRGICQGDSGGPALDIDGQVIGVVSRGGDGCGETVYGSVPGWGEWIREIGEIAAELGGYEAPPWVTEGSSDPALVDADGDGIRDHRDNCPDVANADQVDTLGNGVGDACRPPLDGRGGSCAVCDPCYADEDCGEGALCRIGDEETGICTAACTADADCPGQTVCTAVDGEMLCLPASADVEAGALCADAFVCDADADKPADEAVASGNKADGGGCAASGSAPATPLALVTLAIGLGFSRRRR